MKLTIDCERWPVGSVAVLFHVWNRIIMFPGFWTTFLGIHSGAEQRHEPARLDLCPWIYSAHGGSALPRRHCPLISCICTLGSDLSTVAVQDHHVHRSSVSSSSTGLVNETGSDTPRDSDGKPGFVVGGLQTICWSACGGLQPSLSSANISIVSPTGIGLKGLAIVEEDCEGSSA